MQIITKIKEFLHSRRHRTRSDEEANEIIRKRIAETSARQRARTKSTRTNKNSTMRMIAITAAVLLSASAVMAGSAPVYADNQGFQAFMESEWKESVEKDYLTMHFSVKDYRKMSLTKPEVTLGNMSYKEIEKELEESKASLKKLREFDFDLLNETEQHDYLVYEEYLECLIGLDSYPDMMEMFRPITGTLTNVKEIFEDFPLYSAEDIDDYITLIDDYPRLIDEMIDFTEQQAEKGYFMDDASADDAVAEIEDFIAAGEKNELIVVFNNNLDALDWLSAEDKSSYEEKNQDIILNKVIPAYDKTGKALKKLRGSRKCGGAVCAYPDGRDYYTWLARYNCSSNETLEEKFDFLTDSIREVLGHYRELLKNNPSLEEPEDIKDLETLDEVLEYLRDHMDGFPEAPDVDYKLAYLDESVAEDAMAYYIHCPVDDLRENVIHVNKDAVSDINTLYFTLAHEGYPGHLYQMTWYQNTGASNMRHDLTAMGYQEGWANYVERIMLRRSTLAPESAEFIACDEFSSYMINAACDIAVNGLGYSVKELGDWLVDLGMDRSYAKDTYLYVMQNPGLLLPYGYGQAKFWDFDGRVRSALGDKFDNEEFHLQLLKNGARQFELVEQDLKAYVESKGGTLPDEVIMFADEPEVEPGSGTGNVSPVMIGAGIALVLAIIAAAVLRRRRASRKAKDEADSGAEITDEAEVVVFEQETGEEASEK